MSNPIEDRMIGEGTGWLLIEKGKKAGFNPDQPRDPNGEWADGGLTDEEREAIILEGGHELTDAEKWAIKNYTMDMFQPINNMLAGKDPDEWDIDFGQEFLDKQVQDIISGMDKLEMEYAYYDEVYRGDGWDDKKKYLRNFNQFAKARLEGEEVTWTPFMSTSIEQDTAWGYADASVYRMKYVIEGAGIHIEHLSAFGDNEREVLFKPGSKFKVTSMQETVHATGGEQNVDGETWGVPGYTETIIRLKQVSDK